MVSPEEGPSGAAGAGRLLDWTALIAGSVALHALLRLVGCPAAAFLGPMAAAAAMGLLGRTPNVPAWTFPLSQGFIGALVARSLAAGSLATLWSELPFVAGGTLWGVAMGLAASLALYRLRVLPGPSAFWCLSPGGASVMVLLSGPYGADVRLVAFAQYYRVLLVSLAAVAVSAALLSAGPAQAAPPLVLFPPVEPAAITATVASVLLGLALARRLAVPGGLLLLPMLTACLMKAALGLPVQLPPWLMYPAYALVGWRIGLSFNRSTIVAIVRLIPALTMAMAVMIGGCGLFAVFLWRFRGLSPLTAYLASCPGGLDAVTIIASGSDADLSFIMAMQAMRLIVVILSGPVLSGWITRYLGFSKAPAGDPPGRGGPEDGPKGGAGS
jgi:membrane AbrB-like protein